MSYSLPWNFKFSTPDLLECYYLVSGLRDRIRELSRQQTALVVVREVVQRIDRAAINGRNLGASVLTEVHREVLARQRKISETMHRDPEVDFEFKVHLYPFRDSVYGQVTTEQSSWAREVLDQPWAIDFSYWDGGDRPRDVPQGEWDVRGATWDLIYDQDQSKSPNGAGLIVDMTISPYYFLTDDEILAVLPDQDSRAQGQAHSEALDQYAGPRIAEIENPSMSDYHRIYMDAESWIATDEGVASLAERREAVLPLLPDLRRLLCSSQP